MPTATDAVCACMFLTRHDLKECHRVADRIVANLKSFNGFLQNQEIIVRRPDHPDLRCITVGYATNTAASSFTEITAQTSTADRIELIGLVKTLGHSSKQKTLVPTATCEDTQNLRRALVGILAHELTHRLTFKSKSYDAKLWNEAIYLSKAARANETDWKSYKGYVETAYERHAHATQIIASVLDPEANLQALDLSDLEQRFKASSFADHIRQHHGLPPEEGKALLQNLWESAQRVIDHLG